MFLLSFETLSFLGPPFLGFFIDPVWFVYEAIRFSAFNRIKVLKAKESGSFLVCFDLSVNILLCPAIRCLQYKKLLYTKSVVEQ